MNVVPSLRIIEILKVFARRERVNLIEISLFRLCCKNIAFSTTIYRIQSGREDATATMFSSQPTRNETMFHIHAFAAESEHQNCSTSKIVILSFGYIGLYLRSSNHHHLVYHHLLDDVLIATNAKQNETHGRALDRSMDTCGSKTA